MREPAPTVYVVDDDPDLLKAIERLLQSAGIDTVTFPSPQQFLEGCDRSASGCLVLDLALPGLSGLELQKVLEQQGILLPIVFLTGRGDIAASVQAMKHGAVNFLTKPVDDTELHRRDSRGVGPGPGAASRAAGAGRCCETPCNAHPAGTAGSRADRRRKAEQGDRQRTRHGREDDQVPSRQPDAQDGCACRGRPGEARGARGGRPGALGLRQRHGACAAT